ncbi:hypothetical protein C3L33_03388, partial [Rhododendron williamsianum]
MASSSCNFIATLRPSLPPPPPPPALRRSPPTLQSVVSNPLACSLRLKTASRIGVNRQKLEYGASSAGHVITTEKAKGKVRVLDSEDSLAVSLAEYTAHLRISSPNGEALSPLFYPEVLSSSHSGSWWKLRTLIRWSGRNGMCFGWMREWFLGSRDSNYKLAYDGFLSKVPIPPGNIYTINDALSAEGAADDYETCLKHLVKTNIIDVSQATGLPKFDLMLLGMGPDGHVASLFPRHPLVQADKQWVAFIKDSPKPPPERITFTFPVINSSANIALVAAGAGKAKVVNKALGGDDLSSDARRIEMIKAGKPDVVNVAPSADQSSDLLPVEMVSAEGELTWFLDSEAASKLLHKSSRIGVNPEEFHCKASSSMAEIATEKAKGKVQVFDSEEDLAVSLAKHTADLSDKKLAEAPYIDAVEWSKWHVFWVDERVVPKDHEDSNYKLAFDGFLSKVPIPPGNVYAINDALSAEGAADDYETCLKHLVKSNIIDISQATGLPKFDLMLLGMGPDGHVASLFPGHPLVQATSSNGQSSDLLPVQMVSPEGELTWFLDKGAASHL